ncbi:MAG: ABC transporter ATP-binding protein [Sphaerochaetaceae bacterium]|jgi:ABC-2 type transport system ATP-binding protein|nr:ABC transporter ATP-binding protein [Sphaerochaetaceae bacterium]
MATERQSANVVTLRNLSKIYGNNTVAVDSLSLELRKGEVFGILGPNGAGKTTTIRMMLGLTEPTSGSIDILGMDPLRTPLEVKRNVAYMPDDMGFYEDMSGYENLDYTARFLGLGYDERRSRILAAVSRMGLEHRLSDRVRTYSHGMKRRLALAEVLVKRPAIAILDEPTQGLDPHSTAEFLTMIRSLKKEEGMSVILASHHLNEVQSICDRVGLFHAGRMDLSGTVDELATRLFGGKMEVVIEVGETGNRDVAKVLGTIGGVSNILREKEGVYRVTVDSDIRPGIASALVDADAALYSMDVHRHTLDAVYQAYYKEVHDAA